LSTEKAIEALHSGREAWEEFCRNDKNPRNSSTIRDQSFSNKDFSKYQFKGLQFKHVTFDHCDFSGAKFDFSHFGVCTFNNCSFQNAEFKNASLSHAKANNTNFSNAYFGKNSNLGSNGAFEVCNFEGIQILASNSEKSSFNECNIKNTKFGRSNFASVIWTKCLINRNTDFEFSDLSGSLITKDTSETTRYGNLLRKYYFNWRFIRAIGNFPILGFSWIVFLSSLFLINTIGAINELDPPLLDGMEDLPIPYDALWILSSSLLLALGSTIYSICCPGEVKSFSETQWVYEHNHPRMEYLVSALQKPIWQAISVLSLTAGTLMGLILVGGRILNAFQYVMGG